MRKMILCCAMLISIMGISTTIACAKDNDVSVVEDSVGTNFEELLAPYQKILKEFNSLHGTTYGIMTDEQLQMFNMSRQEYEEDRISAYSCMTLEEFRNSLEIAYERDRQLSQENSVAVHLPYYEDTENTQKQVVAFGKPDKGLFHNLSESLE